MFPDRGIAGCVKVRKKHKEPSDSRQCVKEMQKEDAGYRDGK
jgi:hypothetical protein